MSLNYLSFLVHVGCGDLTTPPFTSLLYPLKLLVLVQQNYNFLAVAGLVSLIYIEELTRD